MGRIERVLKLCVRFLRFRSRPFSEVGILDRNTSNVVIVVSEKFGGTDEKSGHSFQDELGLSWIYTLYTGYIMDLHPIQWAFPDYIPYTLGISWMNTVHTGLRCTV